MITRRWFHPSLNGVDAEKLLMECGRDGYFLARPSTSNKGDFTLSVRRGDEVTHIKIQNNGETLDLYGGEKFATLSELVQHYMENHGHLREKNGNVIKLKKPLNCADPTTERWYHGQLTSQIADRMLLENGKNGSFLVRESQHRPGDFVLSVRLRDRVTHIIIHRQDGQYDVGGGNRFDDLVALVDFYRRLPLVETSGEVIRLLHPYNATRVQAKHFRARVEQLQRENEGLADAAPQKHGFWEEFETLQMMENLQPFDRMEGSKPENVRKNRYKNIVPFDHTRVVLRDLPADAGPGADYINANYVRGDTGDPDAGDIAGPAVVHAFRAPAPPADPNYVNTGAPDDDPDDEELVYDKLYIATQGCLAATVRQFWAMIWQEDVRVIIMTTKEVERGKVKCEKYWPDVGMSEKHDRFTIVNEAESSTQDYTLRRFAVSRAGGGAADAGRRLVYHFHFTAWPDHGVPREPGRVLNILLDVNHRLQCVMRGPRPPARAVVCVHCSAGIGRTGTFIVIDTILDRIRRGGFECEIDVHRAVQTVRDQRSGMVQNEAQYKFIYLAVLEFIETIKQRTGVPDVEASRDRHASPVL